MEDLLASIRKAIDSDVGEQGSSTSGEARGTLMRGALREMRVSLEDAKTRNLETAQEIAELRGRILRSTTEVPPMPPLRRQARSAVEPKKLAPPPARSDFRGIMAGAAGQPQPQPQPQTLAPVPGQLQDRRLIDQRVLPAAMQPPPEPAPALRGRTLQDEFDDLTYEEDMAAQGHGQPHGQPYEPAYQPPDAYAVPQPQYEDQHGYFQPSPQPQQQQAPRMLSNHAEAATEAAFRHLSASLFSQGMGGRSLEDVTRELLRGMLKQWLDDNLPPLVERLVREEISRVARNGR